MTTIGAGGVVIAAVAPSKRYAREYQKLAPELKARVDEKIQDLLKNPRPPGLGFEKLKGYAHPSVYTVHITGNYKLSFEIIEGFPRHGGCSRQPPGDSAAGQPAAGAGRRR